METGREWELNLRAHGNWIGNGNELMGMGGNGNVASHSRTSLARSIYASAVLGIVILSVRPSVRRSVCLSVPLSITRVLCGEMKEHTAEILIPHEYKKSAHLSIAERYTTTN